MPLGLRSLPCNIKGDEDYKVNETERPVSIPNKDPINVVVLFFPTENHSLCCTSSTNTSNEFVLKTRIQWQILISD